MTALAIEASEETEKFVHAMKQIADRYNVERSWILECSMIALAIGSIAEDAKENGR